MTPEQKKLVRESFQHILPISETAARLFYSRLFELDPTLKDLFNGDMDEQGMKLMKMIATAVYGLGHWEEIVSAVEELGKRHVGYGVRDQDYETVGEALIWTLEQGLDGAFTAEMKKAWITMYGLLAGTMRAAAAKAA